MKDPSRFPIYPKSKHHSGQARIRLPGTRQDVYLGKFGSEASFREYERIRAEWLAGGRHRRPGPDLTVTELVASYRAHCLTYYVEDGRPTSELRVVRPALRFLAELYGETPAAQFSPLKLQAVRGKMVEAGLTRWTCNQYTARIKGAFRWGVEQELVPAAVYHGLAAVRWLRAGRTAAPDRPRVPPAPPADVDATLAVLREPEATMVRVQLLSGMRPGEVCRLTAEQIDRSAEPWAYRPTKHKTAGKGKVRWIFFGPRCRALLAPFLAQHPDGRVFRTQAGTGYDASPNLYRDVIQAACDRAGVPRWAPNQLRHTAATEARRIGGIEAAAQFLGHTDIQVTQRHYALPDLYLARVIAEEIG